MPGRRFWLGAAAAFIALAAHAPSGAFADSPLVVRASLDAEINPVTASYVDQAVSRAEGEHAAALLLVLNTPGGLSTAMDDIVTRLLNARVPVVVYVAPPGARADSAGLFVAQAADVVAMAPGTNIGSAHPIDVSGANLGSDLRAKVVNDAVARIRNLASIHGRNADWCERAVRESVNVGADQAVALHVADLAATDVAALLAAIDGRTLNRARPLTLHLAGARVEDDSPSVVQQLLLLLADPNVAFVLLLLAVFGLIAEIATPGAVLPGTVGGISAILALVGFSSLPVNLAGVLLVLFAFVLFVVDLKAPTHGVLTVGGVVSLVVGAAFLIDTGPFGAGFGISPWLIAASAVASAGFFGFVLGKAVAARRRPAYEVASAPAQPAGGEEGPWTP
jgi:membrane-bound serine protease (ClpP class)